MGVYPKPNVVKTPDQASLLKPTTMETQHIHPPATHMELCAPAGCLTGLQKGIEGCVPLIHGSQGCATYIRRYMISHYKEPVDIASSNFSEESCAVLAAIETLSQASTTFDHNINQMWWDCLYLSQ